MDEELHQEAAKAILCGVLTKSFYPERTSVVLLVRSFRRHHFI